MNPPFVDVTGRSTFEVTCEPVAGLLMITWTVVDGDSGARIVIGMTWAEVDTMLAKVAEKRKELP